MYNVPFSRLPVRDRKVLLLNEQGGGIARFRAECLDKILNTKKITYYLHKNQASAIYVLRIQ
jgi:hypothetical protein